MGRVKTYEAIVKGQNIPKPSIPESFKVLIKELQSLALDIKVYDKDNNEIDLEIDLEDDAPADNLLEEKNVMIEEEAEGYGYKDENGKDELLEDEGDDDTFDDEDEDISFDEIDIDNDDNF